MWIQFHQLIYECNSLDCRIIASLTFSNWLPNGSFTYSSGAPLSYVPVAETQSMLF
jgi:hypothetical protein